MSENVEAKRALHPEIAPLESDSEKERRKSRDRRIDEKEQSGKRSDALMESTNKSESI